MPSIYLIEIVAPYLVPYLEIHALAGDLYYFRKESTALLNPDGTKGVWHPRLKHTMLGPYHSKTEGIFCMQHSEMVYGSMKFDQKTFSI